MHRELKPGNILFHDGLVKIGDFGQAKIIDSVEKNIDLNHTEAKNFCVYRDPQRLNKEKYSFKCDVWSAGVSIYECLFENLPWKSPNQKKY